MIVISGVLAIVALILLIIGIVVGGLTLVYISIGVSLVAAVFLGFGAYQRRGEEVSPARATPEPAFGGADGDEVTRVVSPANTPAEPAVRLSDTPSAVTAGAGAGDSDGASTVLVVPGRPRYHVEGCRYLVGKEAESRSVADARNEGYTACGICRPDENLPAARAPETAELSLVGAGADGAGGNEPGDTEPAAPVGRSAATRGTKTAAAKKAPAKTTAKKTATTKTASKTAATKATASKTTASKATASKTAATKAAPSKTAAKKSASTSTSKTAATSTAKKTSAATKKTAASAATVVVIPDRDKFHTSDCRFVKGVRGTARLPKTEARQQGYQACGVCKP